MGDFSQDQVGIIIALTVSIVGSGLMIYAVVTFLKNRTAIYPSEGAATLVLSGPYRITHATRCT